MRSLLALASALIATIGSSSAEADPPTKVEATELCRIEYGRCVDGTFGVDRNPHGGSHVFGGCDQNKAKGEIDLKKWKMCRDWCEATLQKCLADADEVFR